MGIYDRDYYGDEQRPGVNLGGPRMLVTNLVIINVAIFLADILFFKGSLSQFLALKSANWHVWELLTYGFAHSSKNIFHIFGNMFVLWFFGRELEGMYGKQRFLFFYLTALVVSGLIGGYVEARLGGRPIVLVGASGAVTAVLLVFIFNYPRRTLLLWPFGIPIPAWVIGAFVLASDFIGTFRETNVAHSVHLVGAAYGYLFYRTQWSFGNLVPRGFSVNRYKPRPRLRIHDEGHSEQRLRDEVDQILEKIARHGEASLTRKERRKLQEASRHFKERQR